MACFHPLKAFLLYSSEDVHGDIKYRQKICSARVHHLEEDAAGNWWPIEQEKVGECRAVAYRHYWIPCGKCIGCRLDYSRTWANRLMLEYKYHDPTQCWFVTLTYDDANVPVNFYADLETGEARPSLSLDKMAVRQFIKNLRKHYPQGVRYYLCGEYGDKTFRPHYHAIFFSLPLDPRKLVVWKRTDQGFTLFKCSELEKIWRCGNVLVSQVSWETCAYVARYVTKKLNGPAGEGYSSFNLEPPFSLMSRKPGIGRKYFDEHPECIERGLHVAAGSRAINCAAPRYFKGIFKLQNTLECAIMTEEATRQQDQRVKNIMQTSQLAAQDYLSA